MREHLYGVLDELCNQTELLFMLTVAESLFLLLSIFGMLYAPRGSAGFVVWVLNAVGISVLLAISGTSFLFCYRRV